MTARIDERTVHIEKAVELHAKKIGVLEVWKNKVVGIVGFISAALSAYITHVFKKGA
jgi:energy-converting hydrogenase Eha subunit A